MRQARHRGRRMNIAAPRQTGKKHLECFFLNNTGGCTFHDQSFKGSSERQNLILFPRLSADIWVSFVLMPDKAWTFQRGDFKTTRFAAGNGDVYRHLWGEAGVGGVADEWRVYLCFLLWYCNWKYSVLSLGLLAYGEIVKRHCFPCDKMAGDGSCE